MSECVFRSTKEIDSILLLLVEVVVVGLMMMIKNTLFFLSISWLRSTKGD